MILLYLVVIFGNTVNGQQNILFNTFQNVTCYNQKTLNFTQMSFTFKTLKTIRILSNITIFKGLLLNILLYVSIANFLILKAFLNSPEMLTLGNSPTIVFTIQKMLRHIYIQIHINTCVKEYV